MSESMVVAGHPCISGRYPKTLAARWRNFRHQQRVDVEHRPIWSVMPGWVMNSTKPGRQSAMAKAANRIVKGPSPKGDALGEMHRRTNPLAREGSAAHGRYILSR